MNKKEKFLALLLLLFLAQSLAACGILPWNPPAQPTALPTQTEEEATLILFKNVWVLESLYGKDLVATDTTMYADFRTVTDSNRISGNTGCNLFGRSIFISGREIIHIEGTDGETVLTVQPCISQEADDQEREFLKALKASASYAITDTRLEMMNAAGEVILVFRPAGPSDVLFGPPW